MSLPKNSKLSALVSGVPKLALSFSLSVIFLLFNFFFLQAARIPLSSENKAIKAYIKRMLSKLELAHLCWFTNSKL